MIAALILLSLFFAPPQTNATQQNQTAPPQQLTAPPQSPRSYRISGVVVDSISGTPVPHAQVSISPSSGDGDDQTLESDDGNFSFDSVEPGRKYRLDASAPGYVPEFYNQHRGFSSAIAVGDGFDSEHLVVCLHRQSIIYGIVTDERGEPVRHAQVMLLHQTHASPTPSVQGMSQTNDLGEYRFPHLLAGKYFVMVQASPWYAHSGFKYARQTADSQVAYESMIPESAKSNPLLDVVYPLTFYPSATDEHQAAELDLTPGEQLEADIALAPVASVHIRVTNLPTDSKVQLGFQVNQSAFGASMGVNGLEFAQISPGEFEISGLPPGNASLVINQFGPPQRAQTLHANFSVTQSIDASATTAATNVSSVVAFSANPPSSMQGNIWLTNERGDGFSARIHNDGTFSFESSQLQPGTYRVRANINASRGQDYIQQVPAPAQKYRHGKSLSKAAETRNSPSPWATAPAKFPASLNLTANPSAAQ